MPKRHDPERAIRIAGALIWFLIIAEMGIVGFWLAALVHAVAR